MPGNELYRTVHGLKQISAERIWVELKKIVAHPSAPWVMKFMEYHSVLDILCIPEKTEHFDKLKEQGCTDPVLLMCSLLEPGDPVKVKAMAKKLKWSSEETEVALEVAKRAQAPLLDALKMNIAFTKTEHQEHERSLSMKVCEFWGDEAMKTALATWVVPQFPVTGDDLIAMGMKPGKEMGSTMTSLKYAWFNAVQTAGITLTKDQVLVAIQQKK